MSADPLSLAAPCFSLACWLIIITLRFRSLFPPSRALSATHAAAVRMEGSALDASAIVGQAEGPCVVSYTRRDLIIYALGIGAETRKFVHENDVAFGAFPTYPLVLPYKGTSSDVVPFPGEVDCVGVVVDGAVSTPCEQHV